MKFYAPKYKQLDLGLLRSSLDELDKTNRWVALGDLLPWTGVLKIDATCTDAEMCYFVKDVMKFLRAFCLALTEIWRFFFIIVTMMVYVCYPLSVNR